MTGTAHPTGAPGFVIPVLSAANFIIGMGAFMVVGLLNPVSDAFGITPSDAGWLMTFYALGYAVLSPLLVSVTGATGRRRVLTAGVIVFGLSNLIAALAPDQTILFASRVLAAAGAGLVTPVAAAVAAGMSAPDRQARALSAVFFGLTLSQVLGVPAGAFIAYTFGWRAAFGLVSALSLVVAVLIWVQVPAGLAFRPVRLHDLARTLANLQQMLAVSFTTLFLGSIYVIYTYIAPLLTQTMSFGRDGITAVLLLFGLGAVVGNLIGGQITDRIGPFRTLACLAAMQIVIMPIFSALPLPVPALMVLAFVWACFGWAFAAAQQVRLIQLDPGNASVLLALNAAAIYVGAAAGSAVGARVISGYGETGLGIAGGLCAVVALMALVLTQRSVARRR
jgi:predicted MFS family arabinose efflux permease